MVPAKGPVPPNVFAAHTQLPEYEYNPDRARRLLREAGYPDGFETTLWTMAGPRPYMPQPVRIAQALQAHLAAVGIHARIVTFEWGTYLDRVHRGHHDMALLGWQADNGDPDNFLFVHFDKTSAVPPAGNIAFYRNERVHELLTQGRRTVGPAERLPFYRSRHAVRPGITGWAQIQFEYGNSVEDAKEKLEYDLYYVKHANPLLDLRIVLQTIPVMVQMKGF